MKKLILLIIIVISFLGCNKDEETTVTEESALVTQIITPEGGSIETTDGLKITFPNGAVSVDTEVSLGFDGTEPTTFPNPNVAILGDVFSVKINANSLNETAILEIPKPEGYTNLDETTILISNGTTYFPLLFDETSNKLVAQLDYINYTEVYEASRNNGNASGVTDLIVLILIDLQTPPANQLGLKKVDLDSSNEMTFSDVPTLNSTDKVLIMVHGWISYPSNAWTSFLSEIEPLIESSGYTHILTFGYNSSMGINNNGFVLSEFLLTTMNGARVDVVTHSMGGLVSRSAIENHNCDGIVSHLVTLGTPHKGSHSAVLRYFLGYFIGITTWDDSDYNINSQGFRDLFTFSAFLNELNSNPAPTITKYYPISVIKGDLVLNDGVVRKSSALGIQNNDNQSLGSTYLIPGIMPHLDITSDSSIILDVAGYLNSFNETTLPYLNTVAISEITETTAISGGNVTNEGSSSVTSKGICWSNSPNPTIEDNITNDGTGIGSFTSSLTGLNDNSIYYVRAYAINSGGPAYGNQELFTTLPIFNLPTLTTNPITNITQVTASSGGNIVNDGGSLVTERGVCWSTTPDPTIDDYITNDGTNVGSFTSSLTGLAANTIYYVRAYATNSLDTGYGNQEVFTTLSDGSLLTVMTSTVINITQTTATCGGNVTDDGGSNVTVKGVCWSTNPNPTTANNTTNDGTGTGSFTSSLTGLAENTMYYLRAYAINNEGTAYGSQVEFITQSGGGGGIYEGDVTLTTQQEVDDFGANNYSEITGFLNIQITSATLESLSGLTTIGGNLLLGYLANISGLQNLNTVGGNVEILHLNSGSNGLISLSSVGGDFELIGNNIISSNGFISLNSVGGEFVIRENDLITNLEAFNNLQSVNDIRISDNDFINDISALSGIIGNVDLLLIKNNDSLINLVGLDNLSTVAGLFIYQNELLESLTGLNISTFNNGDLYISNNSNLTNLEVLNNINTFNITNLTVKGSPIITNLDFLSNVNSINGDLSIEDNTVLNNLCGLESVLIAGFPLGSFEVIGNAYNPTLQDIIDGNCSQ